jgi:hypothetical protein
MEHLLKWMQNEQIQIDARRAAHTDLQAENARLLELLRAGDLALCAWSHRYPMSADLHDWLGCVREELRVEVGDDSGIRM